MSANNIYTLDESDLCRRADEFVACELKSYIIYDKYKIGEEPDLKLISGVARLRRVVCINRCVLPDEDLVRLSEKLNKIVS